MASIFDSIQQQVTNTAVQQVSARLGIDPVVAQQVANAAIPVITAAIAAHANTGGADSIHRQATTQVADAQTVPSLPQVLGGQHATIAQRVSDVTGISRDGADQIVGAVAPAVLRGIGEHVQQQGLDSAQLATVLRGASSGARQQSDVSGRSSPSL
jgi:hypothetical protein